jgi:hypothetical protein
MPTFIPTLPVTRRVGRSTRSWWEQIGYSLVSFTEIEQGVIDWAVFFADDQSLWATQFMKDLKALVPVLRRSLDKAGAHRLPAEMQEAVSRVLSEVSELTDLRNDIAHMRLRFKAVPLEGEGDDWIDTASHVEVRKRSTERFEIVSHDLEWIRSARQTAIRVTISMHELMKGVAAELGLARPRTATL